MRTRTVQRAAETLRIVTHRDPDQDDIEAIRLLKHHGEEYFPGIATAKIFTEARHGRPGNVSAEELEARGVICVGVAGGRFDEHPYGGHGRKSGDSATTLVAKYLGIYEHPSLQANIAYAFDKNYNARTGEFEIAPLLKLAFRYLCHTENDQVNEKMEQKVFGAAEILLNSAEDNEEARLSGSKSRGSVMRSMDDFIGIWALGTFRPGEAPLTQPFEEKARETKKSVTRTILTELGLLDDPTLRFILEYADKNKKVLEGDIETSFDLATLVALAQKHYCYGESAGAKRRALAAAVGLLLTAMWKKDTNFQVECRKDFSSSETRFFTIRLKGKSPIRMVSVISTNAEIAKYCRSKDGGNAMVVVRRDPRTGNTGVFFDQKAGIDPRPILAALRMAERAKKGIHASLPLEDAFAEGTVLEAEEWYYDGHSILNGSLTSDQPPTALSREEVDQIVERVLSR